jgi:hypothetical protein
LRAAGWYAPPTCRRRGRDAALTCGRPPAARRCRRFGSWHVPHVADAPLEAIVDLIVGVISHHMTTVEHPRLAAQRLERFARILGPENVIGGADCGFA